MGGGGYGNFPYPPRPISFNFLNRTGMGIVFNKQDRVGMEATRPEPTPLPFLGVFPGWTGS